jgi:hypothetical protein
MILFCFQKFKANKLLVAGAAAHHASDEGSHLRKWPVNLFNLLAMATTYPAANTSGEHDQ